MVLPKFPELGCYLLPGHSKSPRDLIAQVQYAEQLGLGSAWISERLDTKEAGVCIGAAAAVTESITVGTAATNINTRHVMVTAAMASSASCLSEGRFALGVARGVGIRYDLWGVPKVSNRHLTEFVSLMKRLWAGERVAGYEGVMGRYPYLHMSDHIREEIPVLFVGFGPKSLEFAGSVFDGVILHTFLSDAAVTKACELVRRGAERAGRDPSSVKIWSVLACGCNPSDEQRLSLDVARMATYLQAPHYGELLLAINDWDIEVLKRFRESPIVKSMPGGIDSVASIEQLKEIAQWIPSHWLPSAIGTPEYGARRVSDQLRAGADGVILHASTPKEFAPLVEAYATLRDG